MVTWTNKGMVTLTGSSEVLNRLNLEIRGIKDRSRRGMEIVGQVVRRAAYPLTPYEHGNLRKSQYATVYGSEHEVGVEIGYTAAYAPYVHEIDKNYLTPGTGWKFLERALQQSEQEILLTLQQSARVDGGVFSKTMKELKTEAIRDAGHMRGMGEGI